MREQHKDKATTQDKDAGCLEHKCKGSAQESKKKHDFFYAA
jgi:hypothetical protein